MGGSKLGEGLHPCSGAAGAIDLRVKLRKMPSRTVSETTPSTTGSLAHPIKYQNGFIHLSLCDTASMKILCWQPAGSNRGSFLSFVRRVYLKAPDLLKQLLCGRWCVGDCIRTCCDRLTNGIIGFAAKGDQQNIWIRSKSHHSSARSTISLTSLTASAS